MRLESARELKRNLVETVLPSLGTPILNRALGVSAGPLENLSGGPATLAVGVARKSKTAFTIAVRIQHRSLEGSPQIDLIRRRAKGEVDVRYIGRVTKRAARSRRAVRLPATRKLPWHQRRNRPLLIGGSVGHFRVTAGTLGCFVRDPGTGEVFILSNNHVLANENRCKQGDVILQPGSFDGGKNPADAVATLARWVTLSNLSANLLDCALGSVREGIRYDFKKLTGIGRLAGLSDELPDAGTVVRKVGRTTGVKVGKVTAFEVDNVVVAYDLGNLRFDNQIEIEGAEDMPFSQGGDSGSLIVDDGRRGIALLFAGGDQGGSNGMGLTYANPLQSVLDELKVELLY